MLFQWVEGIDPPLLLKTLPAWVWHPAMKNFHQVGLDDYALQVDFAARAWLISLVFVILALIALNLQTGKNVITYLELMGAGFATLIVGIPAFGGLVFAAFYNGYQEREKTAADLRTRYDHNIHSLYTDIAHIAYMAHAVQNGVERRM